MDYKENNLKQEYLKHSILTASPTELIVMLYDSCIKNLKLAEISINDRKNIDSANTHFLKAQSIIMELVNCLDTSFEISGQLMSIYEYMLHAIRNMNITKDLTQLPNVLEMLVTLRDTWQQVSKPYYNCSSEVNVG